MYKLTIKQLKDFKDSLIKSTNVLKIIAQTNDSPMISSVIKNNMEQIEILEKEFYI
jgi:acetoacetate decarboxylase